MALLECRNISVIFGEMRAVNDLSFEVSGNEVFGIAGPNGAGKTTLYNRLTGIYSGPGEIIFDGRDVSKLRPHNICRKGIARTFQIPQIFSSLTVDESVRLAATFGDTGVSTEKDLGELMNFVGIYEKKTTKGANLTLLEKKLTMIAVAMATKPKLLLLDEPTAGLSPEESRQCVGLFKRMNKELNIAIIIIEHFMKVLTELAQRLLILESGKKLCLDTPLEVTKNASVIECYLGSDNVHS